jgi:hypothetical protein
MPGVTSGSNLSMTSCEQWNLTSALLGAASMNATSLLYHIFLRITSEERGADVDEMMKFTCGSYRQVLEGSRMHMPVSR